jgi:Na+/melibiose symporter-like transporter
MKCLAIVTTAFCIPMIFFYKQKPKFFPSASAEENQNDKQDLDYDFVLDFKELMKNKNFIMLTLVFELVYSFYPCLATIISPIS